ncbi:Uncharacterized protein K02A2.6 [Stylophora pistillata]|uniref:Uncharacterized protein K02A2.6 n=1 Tax=Stylophora pistillata TaxID=50429 RepID=A0A2B4R781_STYPI|nr:Uncharacterized protein K02A2.6 [Stylophora pistillata]
MTAIGKIESFDETQEKWETYLERVEQFFLANNIDEDHQVPTLLSLIGSKTHTLLRDLHTPDKPATKSFQEIVTTVQQHLSPKPSEKAERFHFYKRIQRKGETVLTYVADLKKLATHCNFGTNLNEALREKLVGGLRNVQIQKRLHSEAKLKYSKALEIAVAMETAIRDAAELQIELQSEPRVDKISDNHTQEPSPNPTTKVCYRCGGDSHATHNCRLKDQACYHRGKVGHISRACRSKQQGKPKQPPKPPLNTQVHSIEYSESDEFENVLGSIQIHNVSKPSSSVIWIDLKVEAGVLKVNVEYKDLQPLLLDLYVVKNKGPVLMGRDWLHKVRLGWYAIKSLKASQTLPTTKEQLQTMLDKYSDVFEHKLGTFKSVEWSEWATPIVPVPKKDGSVRLCGDYKGTVNPELQAEQYPLPRIEDIFAKLAGGQKFSKIDLRQAYHQLEMEEDSRKYLTINTHMGLFQYNRLVFGITSAPAIWQRTIDQVLEGTSGTSCILDDMIITGKSDEEHLANLEEVLRRLQFHGLRANKAKCEFFKEKITYCGHDIDKDGLHKSTAKVEAVLEAPRPNDVAEVRSFLGLINYYHRFLPNLSTTVHPLTQLLGKDHQWKWTEQCEAAFHKVKEIITSEQVLTHYDPGLPLRLVMHPPQFDPLPVTVDNVRRETQRDPVLAQVHEMTRKGWPNNHDPVFNPYFVHKDEITLQSGYLMWRIRVIVPPRLRPQVLKGIYQGHMEVVKMKALARSYTWWLGIDKKIELSAKSCPGPFLNSMLLVVVNAHSRWLEIEKMNTTTSAKTIETLQKLFARYGVPAQLVSDNGPQLTSEELQQFLKRNGIRHITSAPYHPATNALAERAIQSFKNATKSETEVTSLNIKTLGVKRLAYRGGVVVYAKPLLPEERSFLEKGPKFAPTPTNIPHKNILAEIEAAICHLPDDSKDTVRTSCAAILHRGRLPAHNNVSKEERKALNNLKKDQSRVVMKAEKGNRFVFLDRSDYDSKMETLLNDRSTYEVVPTSPFPRIERELNALILSLKRQLKIDEPIYRKIH